MENQGAFNSLDASSCRGEWVPVLQSQKFSADYVRSELAVYVLIQLFIRSIRVGDSHFADFGVIFPCNYWLFCVFLFSLWLTACFIWVQINEVSCCMHVSVNANHWIDPKYSPISSDRLCLKGAAYSIHTVAHACTAIWLPETITSRKAISLV